MKVSEHTLISNEWVVVGVMMMPSVVLAYFQLGQFLMIVMVMSWFYATFIFQSLCAVAGPKDNFGQLSITKWCRAIGLCKVRPEKAAPEPLPKPEEEVSMKREEQKAVSANLDSTAGGTKDSKGELNRGISDQEIRETFM